MGSLFDFITDWLKQGLIEAITEKFANIFESVNRQVGEIAAQVGQTPQGFNSGVFSMIQTLSETVVLPIAGMILTFVLCYELISMIIEKNNMADFDTFNIYKWIVKTFVAVYILSNAFTIVMAVFELGQTVVNGSAGIISGSLDVNASTAVADLNTQLEAMGLFELVGLWMEINIVDLCMSALSVCIFIVIYGRMVEVYLTVSIAPIPLSTMANREWGQMGQNYLKALFAISLQGFLIMICVAIYSVLIQTIAAAANVHLAILETVCFTVLLAFTLFKSGGLSKSLFGAH
jgi:hypothetical protein